VEIYVKKSLIFIVYLFSLCIITVLLYALNVPISQLQTQQLMTSQIRSHIEYLQTYHNSYFVIITGKNLASLAAFNMI